MLDCPPGIPDPKEFTKPTPALLSRAASKPECQKNKIRDRSHILMDNDPLKITSNTYVADFSCRQHFSVADIQDSRVVCNSSNGR